MLFERNSTHDIGVLANNKTRSLFKHRIIELVHIVHVFFQSSYLTKEMLLVKLVKKPDGDTSKPTSKPVLLVL